MKFIDMFAGMGTARMAFEKAGHTCVYSIEWDKHKRKIYEVIFGNEPEGSDIRRIRANELPKSDCWTAGFPCQDISIAGEQTGFRGHRSSLFFAVTRLIRDTAEEDRPPYLLFENVKNFFSVNNGYDFLAALIELDEIGYDCEWQLLNSKYFGVPQNRERVFIVGHLRGRNTRKVFPITGTSPKIDGNRVVSNTIDANYGKGIDNHGSRTGIMQIGNVMPRAGRDNPNEGRVYDINGIAPCLNKMEGGGRQPFIPTKDRIRRLTPRECMRLQGVPDSITGKLIRAGISDTQLYKAAGDAWTVNVGYEIAKRLEVTHETTTLHSRPCINP